MCEFKTQPLQQLMRMIHPDLYRLDNMSDKVGPGRLRLAALLTFNLLRGDSLELYCCRAACRP